MQFWLAALLCVFMRKQMTQSWVCLFAAPGRGTFLALLFSQIPLDLPRRKRLFNLNVPSTGASLQHNSPSTRILIPIPIPIPTHTCDSVVFPSPVSPSSFRMAVAKLSGSRKLLLDPQSLDYMIDHVFLPPQLPQEDDTDAQLSRATIQVLCDSVSRFLLAESASLPAVQPALKMLERFLRVGRGLGLDEAPETQMLRDTIAPLKDGGTCKITAPTGSSCIYERSLTRLDNFRFRAVPPPVSKRRLAPHRTTRRYSLRGI